LILLADGVEHRRLDAEDRMPGQPRRAMDRPHFHAAHQPVNRDGILSLDDRGEFTDDGGEARPEKRFAVAGNLLVRLHPDDGPC